MDDVSAYASFVLPQSTKTTIMASKENPLTTSRDHVLAALYYLHTRSGKPVSPQAIVDFLEWSVEWSVDGVLEVVSRILLAYVKSGLLVVTKDGYLFQRAKTGSFRFCLCANSFDLSRYPNIEPIGSSYVLEVESDMGIARISSHVYSCPVVISEEAMFFGEEVNNTYTAVVLDENGEVQWRNRSRREATTETVNEKSILAPTETEAYRNWRVWGFDHRHETVFTKRPDVGAIRASKKILQPAYWVEFSALGDFMHFAEHVALWGGDNASVLDEYWMPEYAQTLWNTKVRYLLV